MPKISLKQKINKRVTRITSQIINSNTDATSDNNSNSVLANIKPAFPPILTTNDLIENALKTSSTNDIYIRPKTLPNAFIAYRMALTKECHNKNIKLPPVGQFSKIAKNSWNKESQNVKDFYKKLAEDAKSLYKQNKQNTIQIVLDKHMYKDMNESYSTITTSSYTSFSNSSINSCKSGNSNIRFFTSSASPSSSSTSSIISFTFVPTSTNENNQESEHSDLPICRSNGYQNSTVSAHSSHNTNVSFSDSSFTSNSQLNPSPNYIFFESPYELMNSTLDDREKYIRRLLGI